MVTVGRVLFAAVQRVVPPRLTYHVLPFVLAGAFVLIYLLPDDEPGLGIVAFGLAGLGCSALLPLTISFGQEELTALSAAVAGGVIAFYQLGYGIAAFGVGPARRQRRRAVHRLRGRRRRRRGHGRRLLRASPCAGRAPPPSTRRRGERGRLSQQIEHHSG